MALLTVNVNGKKFVVDAGNKGTAKAFGRKQIEVEVSDASAQDVTDFLSAGGVIEILTSAVVVVAAEAEAEQAAA